MNETRQKTRALESEKIFIAKIINYSLAFSTTTNDYSVSLDPSPSEYTEGLTIFMKAVQGVMEGSGSVTLNVNALGAKPITKLTSQEVENGDINTGQIVCVVYDSQQEVFQLQNPSSSYSLLASDIIQDDNNRLVTLTDITNWNNKQDSLGFTPENSANRGVPTGYAPLDGSNKVPLIYLPPMSGAGGTTVYVVSGSVQRLALTGLISGDGCWEYSTGNSYIWDSVEWHLTATPDWGNINIDWENITSKPTSFIPASHSHGKHEVGLGNVDNLQQIPRNWLDIDGELTANSNEKVSSQKAIKTYVDNKTSNLPNVVTLGNKVSNLETCEYIEMKIPPGSGNINKFYDIMNNTNYYSMGLLDTTSVELTSDLLPGVSTASVLSTNGFLIGQEVTIQNSGSIERVKLSNVFGTTLNFTTPANNFYPSAVSRIYRSHVVQNVGQGRIEFGKFQAFSDTPLKLPNFAEMPYNTTTGTVFSPDGTYLIGGIGNTSPYNIVYKRSGDTFTRISYLTAPAGSPLDQSFDSTNIYLAMTHFNTPYITIYKRSGDVFAKLSNPSTLPPNIAHGCHFDSSSTYLAVIHRNSPYITIYKRSGDTFTAISNTNHPLQITSNGKIKFSPDSNYLAAVSDADNYFRIYKRTGDSFNVLTNPVTMPPSQCWDLSWSPDGQHLVISSISGDLIYVYKRSGDTFTKLTTSNLSVGSIFNYKVTHSPNGLYMVVGRGNSPYLRFYKRNGDSYLDIDPPLELPSGVSPSITGLSYTEDSMYLAVGFQLISNTPLMGGLYVYKTVTGEQDATEVDIRYNINPSGKVSKLYSFINKNKLTGFNITGNLSIVSSGSQETYSSLSKTVLDIGGGLEEDKFEGQVITPQDKVTMKLTMTKNSISDNAYISKILGGVR